MVNNYLKDFILAALIGEGERFFLDNQTKLIVSFELDKAHYLSNLLKQHDLSQHISVNLKKKQIIIQESCTLINILDAWYQENKKIFSTRLDPGLITFNSIIISINLFGIRRLESISIPTNIEKEYIRSISYCIESHIKLPVIPNRRNISIPNVTELFINNLNKLSAINSAELANFLTAYEKNRLYSANLRKGTEKVYETY